MIMNAGNENSDGGDAYGGGDGGGDGRGGEWCVTAGDEDRHRWGWGSGWRRCGCGRGFPVRDVKRVEVGDGRC
uniref:Uncharacterized protein n=1 Tax=Helianthus annuus TaxID=4232 RepID=A0A251VCG5_HELAN